MSKRPSMRQMLEKKQKSSGKEDTLEKNDFMALLIGGFSIFGPIVLGAIVLLGLFIFAFNVLF